MPVFTKPLHVGNDSLTDPPDDGGRRTGARVDVSGQTLRLRTIGPFTLREQLYASGLVFPRHTHSLRLHHLRARRNLPGALRRTLHPLPHRHVRFLPAGEAHENEISGAVCAVCTSPRARDFRSVAPASHGSTQTRPRSAGSPPPGSPTGSTCEFSRQDTASEMAIEGRGAGASGRDCALGSRRPRAGGAALAEAGRRDRGIALPGTAQPVRNRRRSGRALRPSFAPVPQIQPLHGR